MLRSGNCGKRCGGSEVGHYLCTHWTELLSKFHIDDAEDAEEVVLGVLKEEITPLHLRTCPAAKETRTFTIGATHVPKPSLAARLITRVGNFLNHLTVEQQVICAMIGPSRFYLVRWCVDVPDWVTYDKAQKETKACVGVLDWVTYDEAQKATKAPN